MGINSATKNYDPNLNAMYFNTTKHTAQKRLSRPELKQNYTIEGVDGHKVSYNLKQLKSIYHPLFNKEASRDTNNSKFRMIKQSNLNRTDCLSENLISIQSIAKPYEAKSIEELVSNDDLARDQTPTCLKETFKSKRKKSSNFSTKKNKISQFMHLNEDLN